MCNPFRMISAEINPRIHKKLNKFSDSPLQNNDFNAI